MLAIAQDVDTTPLALPIIPVEPFEKYVLCTTAQFPTEHTQKNGIIVVEDKDLQLLRAIVLKSTLDNVKPGDVVFTLQKFAILITHKGKCFFLIHRDQMVAKIPAGSHDAVIGDPTGEIAGAINHLKQQALQQNSGIIAPGGRVH